MYKVRAQTDEQREVYLSPFPEKNLIPPPPKLESRVALKNSDSTKEGNMGLYVHKNH